MPSLEKVETGGHAWQTENHAVSSICRVPTPKIGQLGRNGQAHGVEGYGQEWHGQKTDQNCGGGG